MKWIRKPKRRYNTQKKIAREVIRKNKQQHRDELHDESGNLIRYFVLFGEDENVDDPFKDVPRYKLRRAVPPLRYRRPSQKKPRKSQLPNFTKEKKKPRDPNWARRNPEALRVLQEQWERNRRRGAETRAKKEREEQRKAVHRDRFGNPIVIPELLSDLDLLEDEEDDPQVNQTNLKIKK